MSACSFGSQPMALSIWLLNTALHLTAFAGYNFKSCFDMLMIPNTMMEEKIEYMKVCLNFKTITNSVLENDQ